MLKDSKSAPILRTPFVNNVGYTVANQLSQASCGSISETRTYDSLLQLTEVKDLNGSTSVMDMLYTFPAAGANNGQIGTEGRRHGRGSQLHL